MMATNCILHAAKIEESGRQRQSTSMKGMLPKKRVNKVEMKGIKSR